jgi:phage gp45-like
MARRGAVKMTDATTKCMTAQVVSAGQVLDTVEVFEQYGITSRPKLPPADGRGAEAILINLNECADHPVLLCVGDRRYRIKGLAEGEVTLYDDLGQQVYLSRDGIRVLGVTGKYVSVESTDVRLGSKTPAEIEAVAKWAAIKSFMTQILAALNAATAAGGGATLSWAPGALLPSVPTDASAATSNVKAK